MIHPSGTGHWRVYLDRNPAIRVDVPGHTAMEAFEAARARLEGKLEDRNPKAPRVTLTMSDVWFELVSDEWVEPEGRKVA